MSINVGGGELRELKPRILVIGVGGAGGNAINAIITLLIGPTAAIIPFCLSVILPETITAPGAASKNPKLDISSAKSKPLRFPLYSAQQPYC